MLRNCDYFLEARYATADITIFLDTGTGPLNRLSIEE